MPRPLPALLALALVAAGCRNGEVAPPEPPPAIQVPWADEGGTEDAAPDPDAPAEIPAEPEPADDTVREAAPLDGPEKKLSDLCGKCKVKKKVPAQAPYKAVQIVGSTYDSPKPGKMKNTTYSLAIRTEAGWFLMSHLGTSGVLCGGKSLFHVDFDLSGIEIRDVVPGDPPEILVGFEGSAHGIRDDEILICSIGPSGVPSCVGPLISTRNHPEASESWDSGVEFTPEGGLTFVSGTEVTGPFKLVFP